MNEISLKAPSLNMIILFTSTLHDKRGMMLLPARSYIAGRYIYIPVTHIPLQRRGYKIQFSYLGHFAPISPLSFYECTFCKEILLTTFTLKANSTL